MVEQLKACSACGSLEIEPLLFQEGGVPGASEIAGVYHCRKCGRRMAPIVFKSRREYERFMRR